MPPLQFAEVNGIRMGYYEAGPKTDATPIVLCHGWPEIAYSWRHQIQALSEAGLRVIAPDQRGYGATDRPEAVEAYDLEHLTGDLVGLLDHLGIDKAIFVGHDWGGFVVWQMPLRHFARVAGVVGINTPHTARAPIDPIAIFRKRFGESMYIVQFQDPAHDARPHLRRQTSKRRSTSSCAARARPTVAAPSGPAEAGIGAPPKLNLAFPQIVAAYDPKRDPRAPLADAGRDEGLCRYVPAHRLHRRHQLVSQHDAQLASAPRICDHVVRVPSLMIMAELDLVLPPSAADGMETIVPDLEKHLVRGSGHWTPQEKPDEVSATILDWRRRRFG